MKLALTMILLCTAVFAYAYGVGQLNRTYVDPARDNRQIPTTVYYPVERSREADMARTTFPLIVFGHGWILPVSTYSDIRDEFVSAGWIMAFPSTEGSLFPSHLDFALDMEFVRQSVLAESTLTGSELFGILDGFSVLMGHSMGGGASVLAATNSTASAVVTFAAAETDPSAITAAEDVYAPSLTLAGSSDSITPPGQHQIPIYQNLSSSYKSLVSLNGVGHLGIYSNQLGFSIAFAWLDYARSGDYQDLEDFYDLLEANEDNLSFLHGGYPVLALEDEEATPVIVRFGVHPNPIDASVEFTYTLETAADVCLTLYDLRGRKVSEELRLSQSKGTHKHQMSRWDLNRLNAGILIARLSAGGQNRDLKITLLH